MARRSRRRQRAKPHVAGEIELMPMMNVFISIIPLLLMSAAFVQVSVIQASLPSAEAVAAPANETPLDLTIFIRRDAYAVQGNGMGTLAYPRGDAAAAASQLSDALRDIVAAHPGTKEVRIVSEPTTRYEEIIQVMDIARAAGLPEAALADGVAEAS
ncbi:MAG TPA: biopolymer transporter ExbD [Candidatus Sulfotelmatobacter sp.]|nr:biopolymer transporter ExbD [Candidatus Sulfotelmatobacter sp.]